MARILVAEDDEMNRDLITRFLRRGGHQIIHAHNGEEAVGAAQSQKPDLILMDLGMPEMDGWEATRLIKAQPETRNIPVIALTAHATAAEVERAVQAGCDQYETKPVNYQRLLAKVDRILGV